MSCRKASQLISEGLDRPLTRRERMSLRMHLVICRACRRFRAQVEKLRAISNELGTLPVDREATLSEEARARIQLALEERR